MAHVLRRVPRWLCVGRDDMRPIELPGSQPDPRTKKCEGKCKTVQPFAPGSFWGTRWICGNCTALKLNQPFARKR